MKQISPDKNSRIYIAGHRGLVGSAILRKLESLGYQNLIVRTRKELDLMDQEATEKFFENEKPEFVYMAAAKVGGILANRDHPADFIYENLEVQNNVIHSAYKTGVKKLLFLGSTCIYPRESEQPIKEDYLLTGKLEPTNEAYAIAKIAGIIMCQSYNKQYGTNFISAMPTNLYGINDNFDLESSHVLPALIRKFHEAKENNLPEVIMWGTGKPRREFLYVDDLAEALVFLMDNYNESDLINVGTGEDIPIIELAELVSKIVGYEGKIVTDTSKPDGMLRKLVDVNKINKLGWKHKTSLEDGITQTYKWFLNNYTSQSTYKND